MELINGYIVNPYNFRAAPLYISPFRAEDAFKNRQIWLESKTDENPEVDLLGRNATVTRSGTRALELVIGSLELNEKDEVWIVTTSGNSYVSGCVTRTIEKFCRWSLKKNEASKAILVIHEFGFVYDDLEELTKHKLPIIEDCAYSMYSSKNGKHVGSVGDFAVFSMAKMFPVQAGGLVISNNNFNWSEVCELRSINYFKACYHYFHRQKGEIIDARLKIYTLMQKQFLKLGLEARFEPQTGEVPGAFLFKAPGWSLDELKVLLQRQGIESSVFYGEETFYLPCHQSMSSQHVDYLVSLIKYFRK